MVIAGMSGDAGKTLVSLGLIWMLREQGLEVRAYKKGPDYIDAAWLSWASGHPARNLDSFLMGFDGCLSSFARTVTPSGFNLIEGNRGLYDGSNAQGVHSTAELAKALAAPILLVINATKVTRTAAAYVLGCQKLDPKVQIAGVILNQVSSARHERVIREAIESECGVRILGVLPRAQSDALLPARHLGLVTPAEHPRIEELRINLLKLVKDKVDLDSIRLSANAASALRLSEDFDRNLPDGNGLRIGCLRDSALSFYYPENLEIIEKSGATVLPVSPLTAVELPPGLDALYIGGGFPEIHGASLSANQSFLTALRKAALDGLPIYAECGGLMLLSKAICYLGARYPMAALFPWEVEVCSAPQGHGYAELRVDQPNPFFARGMVIRGHEFHYSRIVSDSPPGPTACEVLRGTGSGQGRDCLVQNQVWASYTHIHALGTPQWVHGLLAAARKRCQMRKQ
jgi:cobyrinic acid a,c-diamide synthase